MLVEMHAERDRQRGRREEVGGEGGGGERADNTLLHKNKDLSIFHAILKQVSTSPAQADGAFV